MPSCPAHAWCNHTHVFFALLCKRTMGSLACAGVVFVSPTVFAFLFPAGKDQYSMPSFPTILPRPELEHP
jgi:hypothetical protein